MADAAKKDVSADASEPVRQTGEGKRGDYTPSSGQKKTGKAKRREKRLRNEPKSISGSYTHSRYTREMLVSSLIA